MSELDSQAGHDPSRAVRERIHAPAAPACGVAGEEAREGIHVPASPMVGVSAGVGRLPSWGQRDLPRLPGLLHALGPGIVWMALAQGAGELVFWPYVVAKYGLGLICLLIPACLLPYPVNYEIGRDTLL